MFAFELGREFKLSIAEILSVFPEGNTVFCDEKILIINHMDKNLLLEKVKNLGGTIKVIEILEKGNDINELFTKNLIPQGFEGKFTYSINTFGKRVYNLKELLKISKEIVKNTGLNPRFVNKDFKNVSSTIIIKETLIKKQTDTNIININDEIYIGKTIFVQDIYAYSNRDYSKITDMNIGMLPPKLAQIMINLGKKDKEIISLYDPFVGLGTVLIEGILLKCTNIYGSDINEKMVQTTIKNLEKFKTNYNFKEHIFFQNAKYIKEVEFLSNIDLITTEGYLGEVMTKNNISLERINKQREKLSDLYEGFFSGLKEKNFKGNMVISFPFWDMKGKYLFFKEIYDILEKYCIINNLLDNEFINFKSTAKGSLLYKRDSQTVGREIFSLLIKNVE